MSKRDQQVMMQRKELTQQLVTKIRQSRYMRAEATSDRLGSMEDADNAEDDSFFVSFCDKILVMLSRREMYDTDEDSNNELRTYIQFSV